MIVYLFIFCLFCVDLVHFVIKSVDGSHSKVGIFHTLAVNTWKVFAIRTVY